MTGSDHRRVVIVGAGHGGGTVAALLRQGGFAGEVTLVGEEPVGPYHRPPLSKRLLSGAIEQPLQPKDFYRGQGIAMRTGTCVTAIDRGACSILLSDGTQIPYDVLVLATGALARRLPLPGCDLPGVHELRTVADAERLADALRSSERLAIVGGGWIGLEVAASARTAGLDVTVIEREDRLLARVASARLSAHLAACHLEHGTKVLTGAQVSGFAAAPGGAVASVELADGRTVPCDRVLVGVGAVANDDLAREAGLSCADGVVVDDRARTADPRIYAVGDVTRRPLPGHDELVRLESIPSAVEQARQAVADILGAEPPPSEVPWFWSEQFGFKVQMAGIVAGADGMTVRSEPGSGRLALFHTRGPRVIAVEAVDAPGEFILGKRLIRDRAPVEMAALADPSVSLADLGGVDAAVAEPDPFTVAPKAVPTTPAVAPPSRPGVAAITYVTSDGSERVVEVTEGLSVMQGAVRNNLSGIIAECGGTCSCATCHVYVDDRWLDRLDEPYPEEEELLEFIERRECGSRLSCQLVVTDALHGLVVRIPETLEG